MSSLSAVERVGLLQELVDEIIRNIRRDDQALKTCSLVSSRWLPRCRWFLFEVLKITVPFREPDGYMFWDEVKGSESEFDTETRFNQLVEILDSPLCTFHSSLLQINFHGARTPYGTQMRSSQDWLGRILHPKYLSKWTSVRILSFEDVDINFDLESTNHVAWSSFLSGKAETAVTEFRRRIECLSFVNVAVHTDIMVFKLLDTVSAFANLRQLQLGLYNPFEDPQDEDFSDSQEISSTFDLERLLQIPGPSSISMLDITTTWGIWSIFPTAIVWRWAIHHRLLVNALCVQLDMLTEADFDPFSEYLRMLGSSLKAFDLFLTFPGDFEVEKSAAQTKRSKSKRILDHYMNLDRQIFAHSKGLEVLRLNYIFLYDVKRKCPLSLISPCIVFSNITGQSLACVEIFISADSTASEDEVDPTKERQNWLKADEIITGSSFPVLTKVVILTCVGREEAEGVRESDIVNCFRPLLPRSVEKGLVIFD